MAKREVGESGGKGGDGLIEKIAKREVGKERG